MRLRHSPVDDSTGLVDPGTVEVAVAGVIFDRHTDQDDRLQGAGPRPTDFAYAPVYDQDCSVDLMVVSLRWAPSHLDGNFVSQARSVEEGPVVVEAMVAAGMCIREVAEALPDDHDIEDILAGKQGSANRSQAEAVEFVVVGEVRELFHQALLTVEVGQRAEPCCLVSVSVVFRHPRVFRAVEPGWWRIQIL